MSRRLSPLDRRLSEIQTVSYASNGHPVAQTAAHHLCRCFDLGSPQGAEQPLENGLRLGLAGGAWPLAPSDTPEGPWMWMRLPSDGAGELVASDPPLLYALVRLLTTDAPTLAEGLLSEKLTAAPQEKLAEGLLLETRFDWNRAHNDYVLAQTARTARGFDPEAYLQRLAACGFTHAEVNSLASPIPHEKGVPGEFYAPFYTYCPGLNHFVESDLTRGVYPAGYLQANLSRLKRLVGLCRRYGLHPGLLCFEPRSLPEDFFRRHPTLRGARVDHPFRSHLPRYTLAQDHPATREHYRQLMQNLMREAPELAYLSVWSNDSGAGFEHTASLYVGRNGGPYMIREWRSHEDIAETAGKSVIRYLRLLQETAAEVNPDFEVTLRIEHFKTEHDTIMAGMGDGLSIETPSLLVRGYDLPYRHLAYEEQGGVAGSIHHVRFEEEEHDRLETFRQKDAEPEPHIYYAASPAFNIEPLLGVPFPRLLHRKLTALHETGFRRISALGGLLDVEKTPYWPNPEVIRAVQFDLDRSLDEVLHRAAVRWAGPEQAGPLVALWDALDEAVARLPSVYLYSNFGFVWLRTWVRPLVPDIEAIPQEERQYYERFMVSTFNNPNINDLGRDVLFQLITEASGRRMARQFDENVLPHLKEIRERAATLAEETGEPARSVFIDLRDRIRALQCWATTQRNTCAWVAGVYGYVGADTETQRSEHRSTVREMVDLELENARALLDLWTNSTTEFMLVSGTGETAFIYGENFGALLRKKIRLMEAYGDHAPRIDEDIIWRT